MQTPADKETLHQVNVELPARRIVADDHISHVSSGLAYTDQAAAA
jgi:hypothetical protein